MKILDKYISRELLYPFLFGVLAFSAIIAGTTLIPFLVGDAIRYGLSFSKAIQLLVMRLPEIVAYTFPMSMLLAALLSFSRLSGDSEITAFRAGGISLYRLIIPTLIIGILVSVITLIFNELVVPNANTTAKNIIFEAHHKGTPSVKENVNLPEYEGGYLKRLIYARSLEGKIMKEVTVSEYTQGRFARIIFADQAEWQKEGGWLFRKGIIHQFSGDKKSMFLINFNEELINIEISPANLSGREKDPQEMNLAELANYIQFKRRTGNDVTELSVRFNQKIAIPFASFIFVLLGAPLGIQPQRASSAIGLGLSLIIIFLYYILLSLGMWWGMVGAVTPFMAAWLPNWIVGAVGAYLVIKKVS
jgi:lipopolysaccharide export system permease protein